MGITEFDQLILSDFGGIKELPDRMSEVEEGRLNNVTDAGSAEPEGK